MDEEDEIAQEPGSLAEQPNVEIASGEALTSADVDAFFCERSATVIALVGDADSGKSTLICSIYDRALHGPFASRLSSGIRTIIALERRAHHERLDSGMQTPDTMRTPISDGLQYFHFAFSDPVEPYRREDFLISDRAGELYNRARGNPELVEELEEFTKADVVCILLDGGRLADYEERAGALQAVRQSLRLLTDMASVNQASVVQVVTTKQDLLEAGPDWDTFREQLLSYRERLIKDFGAKVGDLSFLTIAARDPSKKFTRAFGVDALLESWLAVQKERTPSGQFVAPAAATEFDKLAERTYVHGADNA